MRIADYVKIRNHLSIKCVHDVQILSKDRVFLFYFFPGFLSSLIFIVITLFTEDINEVKKNNRK